MSELLFQDDSMKHNLSGKVFHILRERIIIGEYENGAELKENTLAKELGISRTPIREALRQLELEGLVNIIPNKGAVVVSLSKADIVDAYKIRSYIEGLCANMACLHIQEEQLEKLEEIQLLFEFHMNKSHYDALLTLDDQFHLMIYEASNSRMLKHVLTDLHEYTLRVRKITLADKGRIQTCAKEHEAILNALRIKDSALAEELAREHVLKTIDNLAQKNILG